MIGKILGLGAAEGTGKSSNDDLTAGGADLSSPGAGGGGETPTVGDKLCVTRDEKGDDWAQSCLWKAAA